MPWVRFTAPFNYHVKRNVTIAYKPGHVCLVKIACADQAIRSGKAVEIERPRKADKHGNPSR